MFVLYNNYLFLATQAKTVKVTQALKCTLLSHTEPVHSSPKFLTETHEKGISSKMLSAGIVLAGLN